MKNIKGLFILAGVIASAVASAQAFVLTSGTSVADFNFGNPGIGPMLGWTVAGSPDNLYEQGYFISINGSPVRSLEDPFFVRTVTQTAADTVRARYFDGVNGVEVLVNYYLNGSIGNSGDMAEVVTINNVGNSFATFSLFQYNDFDLGGIVGGDTAIATNSSTYHQFKPGFDVTVGVTRIPQVQAAGAFPALRAAILTGNIGGFGANFGPGDATFASQYIDRVEQGNGWQMSTNKILTVPEPATMAALGLGIATLLRRRSKK